MHSLHCEFEKWFHPDEIGVDVVRVIFRCGEGELDSAVVDWKEKNM